MLGEEPTWANGDAEDIVDQTPPRTFLSSGQLRLAVARLGILIHFLAGFANRAWPGQHFQGDDAKDD